MKTFQSYNLHSHTYRCGHAVGKDEDYVRAALDAGFTTLGFSDHVMLPWASQRGIRGEYFFLSEYVASVRSLKKQYKGVVDIRLGFEAEWFGDRSDEYYHRLIREKTLDYLILGQHCFFADWEFRWYADLSRDEATDAYTRDLIAGMETGLFTYVAHPDYFLHWRGEFDERAQKASENIISCAKAHGIPLELNGGPSRRKGWRPMEEGSLDYPCYDFFRLVARYDVPVLLGVDAHNPKDYATTDYDRFLRFAQDLGLTLLVDCPVR